ncbi:UDP-glucose 6-dehydrogenase [Methanospirillum hungatei JF-1]|uniref:UDP-glucose 6-dehydrogenase n=1 Tax=Methanospirillum hungatei JF-1 (strain ATCC 27890 / DSM 864 / NBRC 100397 / JF-1) TaxID=323259 RepID=Q2FS14_METHJ|nr:UDP-glucose/GDP-mannose dehydrogenase family protein [Methanospirillum hungatei]ABD42765.1 UDP-glucose 6-dehydrogenase [Methanospirillum hungatei JF-1]
MSLHISIIGGGYVGLVTGACFAQLGNKVTIIEIDQRKIDSINKGIPPIYEEGLEEILKKNSGTRLFATNSYASVAESDVSIICVGTPPNPDGSSNLEYIRSAATSIGEALKDNTRYHVITVKSTVPPGTTEKIVLPEVRRNSGRDSDTLGFCMNPEFLREGRAIEDFLHPDRIVIGSSDEQAEEVLKNLYSTLNAPIISTSLTAAEMIKYTANSFLATKISFSNEIGNICKKLGIDVYDVMKGAGLDHRIGSHFLNAGAGFGGSCFPKDVSALISLAESVGERPQLLHAVIEINEKQPHKMLELVRKRIGDLKGKRIAVLGLAFKDNTDDIRDSRSIPVIEELIKEGADVIAYDPMAMINMKRLFPSITYAKSIKDVLKDADGCLIMTEWPEFSHLSEEFSLMKQPPVILEGRRIIKRPEVEGICW